MILIACVVFTGVQITLLLGMMALCTRKRTSAHAGPGLRVNCPIFSPVLLAMNDTAEIHSMP
jgi:hypothetical protein